MNTKMQIFTIQDQMYHQSFDLVVNCSVADLQKHIEEKLGEGDDLIGKHEGVGGLYLPIWSKRDKLPYVYVYVANFSFKVHEIAVLAHEIHHFTTDRLKAVKVKDRWEAPAYYFEYIFTKCLNELHDYERNLKKDAADLTVKGTKQGQYDSSKKTRKRSRDISQTKGGRSRGKN